MIGQPRIAVSGQAESDDACARLCHAEVAEFQGLYGAYHVSEVLLQKIWLRGAFDLARLRTLDGEPVRIMHRGTWNRLSGPDFRGAKLRLGDRDVTGDIEVHFRAEAWKQHGHQADPAYDNVVLHVLLFAPDPNAAPAMTRGGRAVPAVALFDLLWHDLEEYAADDAVAALSGHDPLPVVEQLLALGPGERTRVLEGAAERRWKEKMHFAALRVRRCGWEEACHQTALEVLGYRANRSAMMQVAMRFPWRHWLGARVAPDLDALVGAASDAWTLRGVRPANHPRLRLEQYRVWMARVPDWPRRMGQWTLRPIEDTLEGVIGGEPAGRLRRRAGIAIERERLNGGLCGSAVPGVRFDTLVGNLVLPFLAARGQEREAFHWWKLWFPGDVPEPLLEAARQLKPPGARDIRTNGLMQGMLGLHLERVFSAPGPGIAPNG